MDFCTDLFKIKSSWFKNGKIKDIGAKGFWVFINLFKFKLYYPKRDVYEYTFSTSIELLAKETKLSKPVVRKSLNKLKTNGMILIDNCNRLTENHNSKCLIIHVADLPNLKREPDKEGEFKDVPATDDDFYIMFEMALIQEYIKRGLNVKHLLIYGLIRPLQNSQSETNVHPFMSMEKMAESLGMGKDSINHLIWEMEDVNLLYTYSNRSYKKNSQGKPGTYLKYQILTKMGNEKQFLKAHKEEMDKNNKKQQRRKWLDRKIEEKNEVLEWLHKITEKRIDDAS